LSLKDIWEYLNRYIYLPRVKDRNVLTKAVRASVGAMVSGPFAYAERWDEKEGRYIRLSIQNAANAPVVIDNDSVIVKPEIAEQYLAEAQLMRHRRRSHQQRRLACKQDQLQSRRQTGILPASSELS
jgi:hypothetical protein